MRTLAIPLLALLAACSTPQPPTLAPERVKLTGLSATQVSLEVTLDVTNPNAIDLVARSLEAHIVIGKTIDLGTVEIPVTTVFAKNATTKLDVPLAVQFTDLAPLARLAIAGADVPYTVDGTVGLGGELLRVSLPYRLNGTVPRDQVARAVVTALPTGISGLH
jgi:LEA14-like dessication related protein